VVTDKHLLFVRPLVLSAARVSQPDGRDASAGVRTNGAKAPELVPALHGSSASVVLQAASRTRPELER